MNKETSPETIQCESCGKNFDCGAKTGKCWCFDLDLNEETLENLRESFAKCLCQNCLLSRKLTSKDIKN